MMINSGKDTFLASMLKWHHNSCRCLIKNGRQEGQKQVGDDKMQKAELITMGRRRKRLSKGRGWCDETTKPTQTATSRMLKINVLMSQCSARLKNLTVQTSLRFTYAPIPSPFLIVKLRVTSVFSVKSNA
jgi:hypothetical protein